MVVEDGADGKVVFLKLARISKVYENITCNSFLLHVQIIQLY